MRNCARTWQAFEGKGCELSLFVDIAPQMGYIFLLLVVVLVLLLLLFLFTFKAACAYEERQEVDFNDEGHNI